MMERGVRGGGNPDQPPSRIRSFHDGESQRPHTRGWSMHSRSGSAEARSTWSAEVGLLPASARAQIHNLEPIFEFIEFS